MLSPLTGGLTPFGRGRLVSAGFSFPTSAAGWWRGRTSTSSTMPEATGNSLDLQGSATPTSGQAPDGSAVERFSGFRMARNTVTLSDLTVGRTFLLIARVNSAFSTRAVLMGQDSFRSQGVNLRLEVGTTGKYQIRLATNAGTTGIVYDSDLAVDNTWRMHTLVMSSTTAGGTFASTVQYYVSTSARTLTQLSGTTTWPSLALTATGLGAEPGSTSAGSLPAQVDVAEAAILRALTAGELATLWAYFQAIYSGI